jgi:hypothetical protein
MFGLVASHVFLGGGIWVFAESLASEASGVFGCVDDRVARSLDATRFPPYKFF